MAAGSISPCTPRRCCRIARPPTGRPTLAAAALLATLLLWPSPAEANSFEGLAQAILAILLDLAIGVPLLVMSIAGLVQLIKRTHGSGTKAVAIVILSIATLGLVAVMVALASAGSRHVLGVAVMCSPLLLLCALGGLLGVTLLRRVARARRS
jgi:hypothetical protein